MVIIIIIIIMIIIILYHNIIPIIINIIFHFIIILILIIIIVCFTQIFVSLFVELRVFSQHEKGKESIYEGYKDIQAVALKWGGCKCYAYFMSLMLESTFVIATIKCKDTTGLL